jgi:hypothetical protein
MIRLFACSGLLAATVGLVIALGGAPGAPQPEPQPPKKTNPAAGDKNDPAPPDSVKGKEPGQLKDQPKAEPPTGSLKEKAPPAEDPKEVIARITKNMEASEDQLKKKNPGSDTQTIQKKIVDDLDKLNNQQQKNSDNDNSKKKQSEKKKQNSGADQPNNPDKQSQPNPGGGADKAPGNGHVLQGAVHAPVRTAAPPVL